jgi:hypothetical protein
VSVTKAQLRAVEERLLLRQIERQERCGKRAQP